MSLFNTFPFAILLLLTITSEVTSKSRDYFFQNEFVNYEQAWFNCKDKGLHLATAESLDDYNELGRQLNLPGHKGEYFWTTDGNVYIDRSVQWTYITFNDQEMTLISEDGQKVTTRCMLAKDFREIGTSWSYDLCTQVHRYICDNA